MLNHVGCREERGVLADHLLHYEQKSLWALIQSPLFLSFQRIDEPLTPISESKQICRMAQANPFSCRTIYSSNTDKRQRIMGGRNWDSEILASPGVSQPFATYRVMDLLFCDRAFVTIANTGGTFTSGNINSLLTGLDMH
jgi:hypothetical protein